MKKLGFTLMEVLIAVAIIAIVAVIIGPTLSNIMPNEDKIRVIKYHSMLEQAITELLTTEGIYYSVDESPLDGWPDCEGLTCTRIPLIAPYAENRFSGDNKFTNLVSFKLGIENGRYIDGSLWEFNNDPRTITITPNGEGGGCSYSENCLNPTVYIFDIDDDGNVTAEDALTRAYLETPERTNNKALDLERAAELLPEIKK